MKVSSAVVSREFFLSEIFLKAEPTSPFSHSSIQGMREIRQGKPTFWIQKVWQKLSALFRWVRSWFWVEKKKMDPSPYFKVDTGSQSIRYRIPQTENEVKMGPRKVQLEEISFPDKTEFGTLSEMLPFIMRQEEIASIGVTNLHHAWLLWKSGLVTQNTLSFSPGRNLPLDDFIKRTLKTADDLRREKRLEKEAYEALIKIEYKLLETVIDSAIENEGEHKGSMEKNKAARHFLALQRALGFHIDIETLTQKIPETTRSGQAIRAIAEKVPHALANEELCSYPISLQDLFALIQGMGNEIERKAALVRIPTLSFSTK